MLSVLWPSSQRPTIAPFSQMEGRISPDWLIPDVRAGARVGVVHTREEREKRSSLFSVLIDDCSIELIHEVLVDLLQIQKEIHPGIFCVMDGTVCGDGKGPRTMVPKIKDYILASHDSVAIDAIAAKMMGFDPMEIDFIKIAHGMELGCGDSDQIEVVGEDTSKVNFKFSTGKSPIIYWDQMFRKGKLRFFEPVLFHTPLFKIPVFASGFYHDYHWYPFKGSKIVNRFMKTKWGKLFSEYMNQKK